MEVVATAQGKIRAGKVLMAQQESKSNVGKRKVDGIELAAWCASCKHRVHGRQDTVQDSQASEHERARGWRHPLNCMIK